MEILCLDQTIGWNIGTFLDNPPCKTKMSKDLKTFHVIQDSSANALALSPDSSQVVIAGGRIFRVFSIEENEFVEKANLRVGRSLNLDFSCIDVAWNPNDENVLATGATNGAVVTWNLRKVNRLKLDYVYKDHERTVNKVNFHPTEANLLLSGSQDGVMKLFDLRKRGSVSAFMSNTGNAEVVRDVQFSPHASYQFVAGIDNGSVQLWDVRRADKCEKEFRGHGGPVFTLDWHPEVKSWLATGSRDRTIKVWDLNTLPTVRNTIKAVASIAGVRWRPFKKFHIASCALTLDCSISVWDIQRPYIPSASFNEHKDAITGIAWRNDPNSLLSVGKDFTLYHHNYASATHPVDSANPVGLNISVSGDVALAYKAKEETFEVVTVTPPLARQGSSRQHSKRQTLIENFSAVTSNLKALQCSDDSSLSFDAISNLAVNYRLCGGSVAEICEHNADAAKNQGLLQDSATWKIIHIFYGEMGSDPPKRFPSGSKEDQRPPQDPSVDSEQKGNRTSQELDSYSEENDTEPDDDGSHGRRLANIACGKNINFDYFFGDGELSNHAPIDFDSLENYDASQGLTLPQLPNEAFQPRRNLPLRTNTPPEHYQTTKEATILNRTSSDDSSNYVVEPLPNISELKPFHVKSWDYGKSIVKMLHYYVENGNVQMAVTVIIVLGQRILKLLNEDLVEYWFLSYIDILHRLQLWNVATQIIQLASSIPSVHEMNQLSTSISLQCGNCAHSIGSRKFYCNKCSSVVSRCALCHETVTGLYVWCQGCSHGGHINHIQEWLKNNQECPAGCGHLCQYT